MDSGDYAYESYESVRGDLSRDKGFSPEKFNLTDGLKKRSAEVQEKSCELTLVKYSIRLVRIEL